MDQRKLSDRLLYLVGLQVADQVPLERQVRELRLLFARFLDPILADQANAQVVGLAQALGRDRLGDGHEPQRVERAIRLGGGAPEGVPYDREGLGQIRLMHGNKSTRDQRPRI
ncbi:hypothetical protein D3C87_1827380 [compost metagenome]